MKINVLFLHFLFNFTPTVTHAALCEDITGRWINKLGSELDIDHLQTGLFHGKYYTAVSSTRGKLPGHNIVGRFSFDRKIILMLEICLIYKFLWQHVKVILI